MTQERYSLTLQSVPNRDVPPIIRLRAALKVLLRGFGLRCVGLKQENLEGSEDGDSTKGLAE